MGLPSNKSAGVFSCSMHAMSKPFHGLYKLAVRYLVRVSVIACGALVLPYQSAQAADIQQITIPPLERSARATSTYYHKLLALIFAKTEATDGPAEIKEAPAGLTTGRILAELNRQGLIDVIWAVTDATREEQLLPIKIPLIKGLNGYRVLLIREADKEIFKQITTLDDLRRLNAGQGMYWADTGILKNNGLNVVTAANFDDLFTMLENKRFDYFPRGLDEVWDEQKLYADGGIIVDDTVMLHYDVPKYFFVNKNNKKLADRIERGLKMAMADGSYEALFNSYPGYKHGFEELESNKRRVFTLKQ